MEDAAGIDIIFVGDSVGTNVLGYRAEIERFVLLRETAFRDPSSSFRRYAYLSVEEARTTARSIWQEINGPNLRENILLTRERAHLILEKGPDHSIQQVRLRKG